MPDEEKEVIAENEPIKPVAKPKDRSFRFLMAQTVLSILALAVVLLLKALGGNIYSYSKSVFKENFDKPINIDQVLSADEAKKIVSVHATVYGQGGESDDEDVKYIDNYEDISGDVSDKINSADINKMSLPVRDGTVTCEFGYRTHPITGRYSFHKGIDIGEDMGADIMSALSGTVKRTVENDSDYGNYIIVTHADGVETMYAHCSRLVAKEGQSVKKGEVIAKVGSTGMSTGPHLHFEIRVNDIRLNPRWFIDF